MSLKLTLRCCDFQPSHSSCVTGILPTDYTASGPSWEVCLCATKSHVPYYAKYHTSFHLVTCLHMFQLRDFLQRKQENKDINICTGGQGRLAVAVGIAQMTILDTELCLKGVKHNRIAGCQWVRRNPKEYTKGKRSGKGSSR